MPEVTLTVDGIAYGGWKGIRVSRSIETISGSFSLTVSERWPGQPHARAIEPGAACTVAIEGETLITGYVDEVSPSYDAQSHTVEVSGRDRAGDLVDCTSEHVPGEWHGRRLEQIADELAAPFGVQVRAETSTGKPFTDFRIQEGEAVFEAIERMCRMRAVLVVSDGQGGIVFTRAGATRAGTELVLGQNVERASGTFSDKDRFSRYVVKGQQRGTDDSFGDAAAGPSGVATDPGVRRYRPLVVVAEDQGDGVTLTDRARWEATVRAGRARKATYTVTGWQHAAGLWQPNTLVRVRDSWVAVDREMLIVGVSFSLDESGSTTELELARPDAFALIELTEKKKKSKSGNSKDGGWGDLLEDEE